MLAENHYRLGILFNLLLQFTVILDSEKIIFMEEAELLDKEAVRKIINDN